MVMDNAIANARKQKANTYYGLVDSLCRKFPHRDVRFCAMVLVMMGMIPTSIKQILRKIQLKV